MSIAQEVRDVMAYAMTQALENNILLSAYDRSLEVGEDGPESIVCAQASDIDPFVEALTQSVLPTVSISDGNGGKTVELDDVTEPSVLNLTSAIIAFIP
jgi:hypothetical protein